MSDRSYACASLRRSLLIAAFAGLMVVVTAAPLRADGNPCTTSGGQLSCSAIFTTSGQSMFGLGQGEAIYHQTFGTSWDKSGKAGHIYNPRLFGVSLGQYGAEVRASSKGNLGLTIDLRANAGTVDAWAPGGATLSLPDTSKTYRPGELVTISSTAMPVSYTNDNFGFSTQSPTLAASAQFGFGLQASVGATLCVVSCTGFDLGFNTGQHTVPLFSYNENLKGTAANQISIDNSGLKLFGKPITEIPGVPSLEPKFEGDLSRYIGMPANTWTVTADATPAATSVQTSSAYTGGNSTLASGVADEHLLRTDVDVAKVLTNVGGVALSSGTLGDVLPPGTPGFIKTIGDSVGFTLVKTTVGLGLGLGQDFSMQAPSGTLVTLGMKSGNVELPSVTFHAGESVQFRMPDAVCTGDTCTAAPLTITTSLSIDPLGFSSNTKLNADLLAGVQALGLDLFGLNIGPLVNWSKDFNLGSISLFKSNFELGGFNSIDAGSITLNSSIEPGGTPYTETQGGIEVIRYSNVEVSSAGLTLPNGGTTGETLIGSNLRPADGLTQANITMGPSSTLKIDSASTISSMNITGTGGEIRSGAGVNKITDTVLAGNNALTLNVGGNGTMVLKNSQFSDVKDMYVAASWSNGSWTQGALVLDHSTLTLDGGYPSIGGKLILQNGSYASIVGKFYFYNEGWGIDVMSGSTLDSHWIKGYSANMPGFPAYSNITVGENATLNVDVLEKGQLDINGGGTVNVTNLFGVDVVNINGGTLAFRGSGGTENMGTPIHLNSGVISVSGSTIIDTGVAGSGELRVLEGGDLTLTADRWGGSHDYNLGEGSKLNIGGVLRLDGQAVNAGSAVADVGGMLQLLPGASLVIGELNLAQGSRFEMWSGSEANAGSIRNFGDMVFEGARLSSDTTILNAGSMVFTGLDGTVVTADIESIGGNLRVEGGASLALQGTYVQQSGSVVIDGNTAMDLTLNGGTLSGAGQIAGNVTNLAGIVQPGDSPGTLTIFGNYVQGQNGMLEIEIASLTDFDRLLVNGNVSLDGVLRFDIDPTLFSSLTLGDSFDFLSVLGGNLFGTFSQVQFDYRGGGDLPFGFGWELLYGSSGASLKWVSAKDYGPLAIAIDNGTPVPTVLNGVDNGLSPEVLALILANFPGLTQDDLDHIVLTPSDFQPNQYTYQAPEAPVPEPGTLVLAASGLLAALRYARNGYCCLDSAIS